MLSGLGVFLGLSWSIAFLIMFVDVIWSSISWLIVISVVLVFVHESFLRGLSSSVLLLVS